MPFVDFLSAQLREPQGWFGRLFMGRLINRANRRLSENTVEALGIGPNDTVLEIGFGGGAGLAKALQMATSGTIQGIDFSTAMVDHVRKRFRSEIENGRLQVRLGNVSNLPYGDGSFNQVFAVNNIYFWPDVDACLREVLRVLKEGGKVGIGNRSKEHMSRFSVTKQGFRLFSAEELSAVLIEAGFRDVRVEHKKGADRGRFPDQVIGIGTK